MPKCIYCINKAYENEFKIAEGVEKNISAKRVNIVSIKMVREASILYNHRKITSPHDAAELGRNFLEDSDREQCIVCTLDTKNQPTSIAVVSMGSLNSSIIHPREIFKSAILSNAAGIIIFHNHPSGDTTPSKEDISISKRLKESGQILGIDLIDHIIIGSSGKFKSMKDEGVI